MKINNLMKMRWTEHVACRDEKLLQVFGVITRIILEHINNKIGFKEIGFEGVDFVLLS
jgi:predicted outer membrane lipoprotein